MKIRRLELLIGGTRQGGKRLPRLACLCPGNYRQQAE
jgi:hypothetical protein